MRIYGISRDEIMLATKILRGRNTVLQGGILLTMRILHGDKILRGGILQIRNINLRGGIFSVRKILHLCGILFFRKIWRRSGILLVFKISSVGIQRKNGVLRDPSA